MEYTSNQLKQLTTLAQHECSHPSITLGECRQICENRHGCELVFKNGGAYLIQIFAREKIRKILDGSDEIHA